MPSQYDTVVDLNERFGFNSDKALESIIGTRPGVQKDQHGLMASAVAIEAVEKLASV